MEKKDRNLLFVKLFKSPEWKAVAAVEEELLRNYERNQLRLAPRSGKTLEEHALQHMAFEMKRKALLDIWAARNAIFEEVKKQEEDEDISDEGDSSSKKSIKGALL